MSTYTWTITDESNNKASLRFTPPVTGSPVYDFCNIRIGDNLVILGPEFSAGNRGSFSVLSVSVATRTITYNNPSATSETVNLPTVAGSLDKVTFWRAPVSTVYDCNNPAYVTTEPNTVNGIPCRKSKVSLPVSTDIVVRDSSNGAYLSEPETATITALSRLPDGTTTFTATGYTKTSGQVEISGFLPKLVEASDLVTSAGTPPGQGQSTATLSIGTTPKGVFSLANRLYVTNSQDDTLQIFDISSPLDPVSIKTVTTGSEPINVYVAGNYAYVLNLGDGTLQVVDVSVPANASVVGSVSVGSVSCSLFIQGSYAYVLNSTDNTLVVVDVSDPTDPTVETTLGLDAGPRGIYISGDYAYIVTSADYTLQVIDISTPASPSAVGTSLSLGGAAFDIFVKDEYAYVPNWSLDTLQVIDISTPASPSIVGSVSTDLGPCNLYAYQGSVYLLSYYANTLQTFDVTISSSPSLQGSVAVGLNPFGITIYDGYIYVSNSGDDSLDIMAASPFSYGRTAASQFSHSFTDVAYKGCGGVAVTDLKQAVAIFGGRNIETSTDIHKIYVYTPGNTIIGSQQEVSRLYTWVDSTFAGICGTGASAVVIDHPRFWNKILLVGGYPLGPDHATGPGFTQTAAYLYSIDDDTLEETGNDPAPWPSDCALAWTGEYAVALSGQLYDGSLSTYVSVWDPEYATNFEKGHWYMSDEHFISEGRANAQAVTLNNGKVLLIGGRKLVDSNTFSPDNIGTPIASCELITPDPDFATATVRTGPMTYGRFAFGTVKLPDGRVLVIGGIGCKPCQPVVTIGLQYVNELSSCEIYDPSLGIWSPIPDTLDTHSYCTCGYDANTNRVYVVGGAASKKVEYLDLNTMTWHYSVAELSNNSYRGCGSMVGHIEGDPVAYPYLLRVGGSYLNNLYQEKNDYQTFSIQIYNEVARGNGINGVHKITASNTFTTNTGWTKSSSNSFVTTVTAQEASIKGPYLYDKTQIFAVNGITLTSETIIPQGRGCPLLTITEDISDIPLEGFFVANFGRKTQVGPIKYTKIGSKIQPDPHFDFPEELLTSTLSLVTKGAYVPTIDQQRGAFYLTASNAGLDAARQYVTDISAGGIDLDIEVRYPGDRGLGDEGQPAKGSHKLSDVIEVFGPDNLDDFLEEARNGQ